MSEQNLNLLLLDTTNLELPICPFDCPFARRIGLPSPTNTADGQAKNLGPGGAG